MYKNKLTVFLSILFIIMLNGCSNSKINVPNPNSKNSTSKTQIDPIDNFLSNQKFDVSKDSNKKIIYIYFPNTSNNTIKKYEVTNNGVIDVNTKTNQEFVISLPENSIISATWNIQNNIDNSDVKLLKKSKLKVPFKNNEKLIGINYDRRNFYFKTLKKSTQAIVLTYSNKTLDNSEYFRITINTKTN
ncbi:Chagasin family peptidase inhibitor I42 [Clostridium acidisoli DSM 12555]|uniref:Chagasin family peptidase inhibitor I42 n=1 Tax=Clostridium acidisoli DSM 12555 TaxID=1121291 RepID=A0A1W1WZJ2_9CLOT|nr:protease inhibitor I42 family protein [Clostridium acidisoli]SMC16950.1 Chagasin family peptidase inhibitor I42 [Clostridium acidisoli DSM 12555]